MKGNLEMEYVFEPVAKNFEDFASGRVLYNAHGTTAFPVRLASEIIQRCFEILKKKGKHDRYTIYDPCCGGAYLLTVIGLMHGHRMKRILASDSNPEILKIAEKNLSLLTRNGMRRREEQIQELFALYRKPSHLQSLESIERLSSLVNQSNIEEILCFHRDITMPETENGKMRIKDVHVVITDFPYGNLVSWTGSSLNPAEDFFDNIYGSLDMESSVVAVVADKSHKLQHDKFRRVQHFKVGKRQVGLFEPINM